METQEKEFYAPIIRTYNNNLSKRWRIEWEEPIRNGILTKRLVKYGFINKGKTCEERLRFANKLIEQLKLKKKAENQKAPKKPKENILSKTLRLNHINWRKATARAYKTVTQNFTDFLGDLDPALINETTIQDYIFHLNESKASIHKIKKYLTLLKATYEKAVDFKLIEKNPIPKLKLNKPMAKSLLYFNDVQIKLIRESSLPGELLLGIQLLFYCFIRPGEASELGIGL